MTQSLFPLVRGMIAALDAIASIADEQIVDDRAENPWSQVYTLADEALGEPQEALNRLEHELHGAVALMIDHHARLQKRITDAGKVLAPDLFPDVMTLRIPLDPDVPDA